MCCLRGSSPSKGELLMRSINRLCLLLVLLVPFAVHAQEQSDVDASKAIVAKFVSGYFAGIYVQLGDQVKSAVTQDQLGQAWEGIVKTEGAFQIIADINPGTVDHSV